MKIGIWLSLAGVVACAAGGFVLSAEAPARKASTYTDGLYGFSIGAPEFPAVPKGANAMPVMLLGPAEEGFSPNVNVLIIPGKTTRKQVVEANLTQFKTTGWKMNSTAETTRSGKDAVLFDYEGRMPGGGAEMHWLCLIVVDDDRQLVVTCTALKGSFGKHEQAFRTCLASFKLDNQEAP
jgi:hypothetical protein